MVELAMCIAIYIQSYEWCMGVHCSDEGDGSSSGLFSGVGFDTEEEEERVGDYSEVAECVDDMSGERDERVDLTSSTAYTAAMCSLHCMESVTSNPLYQVHNA